jgi:polyhydroxybutyrate depolymerase
LGVHRFSALVVSISFAFAFFAVVMATTPTSASSLPRYATTLAVTPNQAAGSAPGTTGATDHATTTTHSRLNPGDHTVTLTVGNLMRSLILHIPANPPVADRALILVFHGADDTAANTIGETDFEQVANKNGELVAFMQGYDDTWNEGAGHTPAEQAHVNDVAFTSAAITKLEGLVPFDHSRVAVVGFSNGALMVEDLGCHLAGKLALIVPVEGPLPVSVSSTCAPSRPLSVLEIHGTADNAIPYDGGPFVGVGGGTTVLSAPSSAARWAVLDHCSSTPTVTDPSSTISLTTYSKCHGGVSVTLRTINGGGHEWGNNIGQLVTKALAP